MININLDYSYLLSDIFAKIGIEHACISPGMRNSALTIAFSNNNSIECTSHIDERSCCFFALGLSKQTEKPIVVISTSGTAVANLFPGVIEANLSKKPLIIVTADRPMELLDTGENQTINQKNLFGNHVRKFCQINIDDEKEISFQNKIIDIYNHCVGTADNPPGPIHLNLSFKEPLTQKSHIYNSSISNLKINNSIQFNDVDVSNITLRNSIIVCGEISPKESLDSIIQLSEYLNAPILADPTSNIRFKKIHKNIISSYNFLITDDFNPETIIRFGRKPISKFLCKLIKEHPNTIYVDRYPQFNDDSSIKIRSTYVQFVNYVKSKFDQFKENSILGSLYNSQASINNYFTNLNTNKYNCEGILINRLIESIQNDTNIFIGNSMAIRQMEDFTINTEKNINIYCNRGASGIDGLVSTSLGISYADNECNNISIIGDLSLYHDMNGLLIASKLNVNLKLVVLNNNGGGIFSDIKVHTDKTKLKKFWITPTDINPKDISRLYKINYFESNRIEDIIKHLSEEKPGPEIIDYKIDMELSKTNRNIMKKEIKETR